MTHSTDETGIPYKTKKMISVFGTGISFSIFMVWGFFLGVFLFPAIRIFKGKRARDIFHSQVRFAWRIFIHIMQITRAFRTIQVTGLSNLPKDKPVLLIGNHLTLIDIVVLGAYVPMFNCVVKTSLWNHPFFGSVVKACDFIPNVASEEFLERCNRGFAENRPLIIFPQGQRIPPEQKISFQRGAAQIAIRTGVSVHPVVFQCHPVALQKGVPWYKAPALPTLTVHIERELPPPDNMHSDYPIPKKVRMLTAYWENYFTIKTESK